MQEFILNIIEQFGYFGVLLLIAIENLFPPIPSEVILLFAGFFTARTSLSVVIMILMATLGSLLGAFILYYIGKLLNKDRLKRIVSGKIGKVLRLEEKDIDKADAWFDKTGNKAVFLCRFVPIVRSLISIPAGMNKMNVFKFTMYTVLGSLIWNTCLIIAGNQVGDNWPVIANIIDKYSFVILISLIVLAITFIFVFYYKKSKKKSNKAEE